MPFKIVEKKTRWCLNWAYFKNCSVGLDISPEEYREGLRFKKQHPEFFPHYFRGRVIKAAPGSLGIMCFPTRGRAEGYKNGFFCRKKLTVVEVEGIGSPKKVDQIIEYCGIYPWRLCISNSSTKPAPHGTVAFPAVKVLE